MSHSLTDLNLEAKQESSRPEHTAALNTGYIFQGSCHWAAVSEHHAPAQLGALLVHSYLKHILPSFFISPGFVMGIPVYPTGHLGG